MSYSSGHPWYYVTGGKPLYPSQIKAKVDIDKYAQSSVLIHEILKASQMEEPKRSQRLRQEYRKVREQLLRDLRIYLASVRKLKARRAESNPPKESLVTDVNIAMSLKHNHIYHGYSQLKLCEHYLSEQADLFGFFG